MISEHNHDLFSSISLCSVFNPDTQGVVSVFFVSVQILRFFIGREQERSGDGNGGDRILISSSSANRICLIDFGGESLFSSVSLLENFSFLFETGVFLAEDPFTGVFGVRFKGVDGT